MSNWHTKQNDKVLLLTREFIFRFIFVNLDEPFITGHNCNFCNHNLSQEIGSHIPEAYDPPVVAVLPCGHVFHNDCFNFFDSSENPSNPRCIICAPNCSEIFPTLWILTILCHHFFTFKFSPILLACLSNFLLL